MLGLLVGENISLEDVRRQHPAAQYMKTILRHCIGANVVDEANQICHAYRGLAPELKIVVTPPTESTKTSDFTQELEKGQVLYEKLWA